MPIQLASPNDVLESARLSPIPLPLSGAVLSASCALNADKIELLGYSTTLGDTIADSSVTNNVLLVAQADAWAAGKFTALANAIKVKVTLRLQVFGTPPNKIQIHIYSKSGANPGASIGSIVTTIPTTTLADYSFDITTTGVVLGTDYFVVIRTSAGDLSNGYAIAVQNSITGGNYYDTTNAGVTWTANATQSVRFLVQAYVPEMTGTATFRVSPAQVGQHKQIAVLCKINANNTMNLTAKDILGNTIFTKALADGWNIIDISQGDYYIDPLLYKQYDIVVDENRVTTTDATPELHYVMPLVDGEAVMPLVDGEAVMHPKSNLKGYYGNNSATNAGYLTALNTTNKQGVASIFVYKQTVGTGLTLRITKDGIVTTVSISASLNAGALHLLKSDLSDASYINIPLASVQNMWMILAFLAMPIFYKNSLWVEIKSNDANAAVAHVYTEVFK